jgi:hypothetical protein
MKLVNDVKDRHVSLNLKTLLKILFDITKTN